jgi:lipoprotein-releasing system permease protein
MTNHLSFFIACRYLFSKRRERFVSFVSFFSILAMSLGVMTLITVLSVMNGFDHEIKTRILQIIPHATLDKSGVDESSVDTDDSVGNWQLLAGKVSELTNVSAVVPYVEGQGMLTFRSHMQGVGINGILPAEDAIKNSLGPHLIRGQLNELQAGQYNMLVGRQLARALDVGIGDEVLLTLPDIVVTPAGIYPRVKKLRVSGIFETGAQVDSSIIFIHLNDARKLLRLGDDVSGLRLFFNDPFSLESLIVIRESIPDSYQMTTWQESMRELFAAIKMEKAVVGLLLSAIIGVAAFNIIASLVLMVNEKRTDIAVLRTLGSSAEDISRIFRIQGGLTGFVGVILGLLAGCALALYVGEVLIFLEQNLGFALFDPELYFITQLPSQLHWQDVALVAALALLLSLIATWYPARRAGRIPPADALRYK